MINTMDMDKDLSTFGEATNSKGNPTKTACSSRLLAADEKKNEQFSWQLTISLLPATLGL